MTLARPREAALHEAATRLFRQRGFHATSMQDLAEDLGMNRGSLYHYIEAKDDLLWAIVNGAMERSTARCGRSWRARTRSPSGLSAPSRPTWPSPPGAATSWPSSRSNCGP